MCPRSIAGVPSSQALLGFIITAPQPVCVPAVIGALAVRIQNQKKIKMPMFLAPSATDSKCAHCKTTMTGDAHAKHTPHVDCAYPIMMMIAIIITLGEIM